MGMAIVRALLVLLAVLLVLPRAARADTGWATDLAAARHAPRVDAPPMATIAPLPPTRPFNVLGGTGGGAAVQAPASGAARLLRVRVVLDDTPPDHSFAVLAARSRHVAAARDFLELAPARARATRGVVGFHGSPPPPLA